MPSHKIDRVSEDISRELTDILRSLKDPRITGLLSVVHVDVTNDLSYCTVYVSAVEGIETAKKSVEGLKSASGFIRRELSLRLSIRHTPQLKFVADDSIERSAEISKKIDSVLKGAK